MSRHPDDMDLDELQRKNWPQVAAALDSWDRDGRSAFLKADRDAKSQQWYFRRLVCIAAIAGAVATGFALEKLARGSNASDSEFDVLDLSLTAVIGGCILIIYLRGLHYKWLISRYQAEAFRISRYRFLIKAICAGGANTDLVDVLKDEIGQITACGDKQLESLARKFPTTQPEIPKATAAAGAIKELVQAYLETRIVAQQRFFGDRSTSYRSATQRLRNVAFACLIVSVCISLFTPLIERFLPDSGNSKIAQNQQSDQRTDPKKISYLKMLPTYFLFIGLFLPVASGALRTIAGAWETGRNLIRYEAVADAIKKTQTDPNEGLADLTAQPQHLVDSMWLTEQIFERENAAWLRLMMDVESFG